MKFTFFILLVIIIIAIILISIGEVVGKSKYNDLSKSLNIQLINSFTEFESKKNDIMKMNPDKKKYDDAQLYAILTIVGIVLLILGLILSYMYIYTSNSRKDNNELSVISDPTQTWGQHVQVNAESVKDYKNQYSGLTGGQLHGVGKTWNQIDEDHYGGFGKKRYKNKNKQKYSYKR